MRQWRAVVELSSYVSFVIRSAYEEIFENQQKAEYFKPTDPQPPKKISSAQKLP